MGCDDALIGIEDNYSFQSTHPCMGCDEREVLIIASPACFNPRDATLQIPSNSLLQTLDKI